MKVFFSVQLTITKPAQTYHVMHIEASSCVIAIIVGTYVALMRSIRRLDSAFNYQRHDFSGMNSIKARYRQSSALLSEIRNTSIMCICEGRVCSFLQLNRKTSLGAQQEVALSSLKFEFLYIDKYFQNCLIYVI